MDKDGTHADSQTRFDTFKKKKMKYNTILTMTTSRQKDLNEQQNRTIMT